MLTVYLYIRVSTDEQAIKGYSQRSQADKLTYYCKLNHFSIAETIFEDFSAKTFNRPEWNKLYSNLKVLKNQFPIILSTYWDRFSRNITDAYHMLEQLQKIKILVQAIEHPIDFSVPESKIILAMYLATSEVENDKRSRNVSLGMQKARLEEVLDFLNEHLTLVNERLINSRALKNVGQLMECESNIFELFKNQDVAGKRYIIELFTPISFNQITKELNPLQINQALSMITSYNEHSVVIDYTRHQTCNKSQPESFQIEKFRVCRLSKF